MNSRILKKHCKRADSLIQRLNNAGFKWGYERFVTNQDHGGDYWQEKGFDQKSYERFRGKNWRNYIAPFDGTVGYGHTSGGYEPEWSDTHAYRHLCEIVSNEMVDWDAVFLGGEYPRGHYYGPRYRDHQGMFAAAEKLIAEKGSAR